VSEQEKTEEAKPVVFDFEGLTPEQQEVLKQVFSVHEIERTMLSRAIEVIVRQTGKPVKEVVSKLAEGLNDDYNEAVQQETRPKPKLYIPH